MESAITIPRIKYAELLRKAEAFDSVMETEKLTMADIRRIEKAKKTKLLTEDEFSRKYLS